MKATQKKEVTITLELTREEAIALKGLVQNPNCEPDDEPVQCRQFRHNLFALLEQQVG